MNFSFGGDVPQYSRIFRQGCVHSGHSLHSAIHRRRRKEKRKWSEEKRLFSRILVSNLLGHMLRRKHWFLWLVRNWLWDNVCKGKALAAKINASRLDSLASVLVCIHCFRFSALFLKDMLECLYFQLCLGCWICFFLSLMGALEFARKLWKLSILQYPYRKLLLMQDI